MFKTRVGCLPKDSHFTIIPVSNTLLRSEAAQLPFRQSFFDLNLKQSQRPTFAMKTTAAIFLGLAVFGAARPAPVLGDLELREALARVSEEVAKLDPVVMKRALGGLTTRQNPAPKVSPSYATMTLMNENSADMSFLLGSCIPHWSSGLRRGSDRDHRRA